MPISNLGSRLKMFTKILRDYKIGRNHRERVRSIVLKSNEDIVRALDEARALFLEAERKELKDETIKYRAMRDVLEWLISETE